MATWMEALKAWNAKQGGKWKIPKKGSAEYDEVKKMMGPAKEKAEPKKADKKASKKSEEKV